MKKRQHQSHRKRIHHRVYPATNGQTYLVMVRSWMLVVLFALMLGVGAILGNFLNQKLNESSPTVAGVEIEAR